MKHGVLTLSYLLHLQSFSFKFFKELISQQDLLLQADRNFHGSV